MTKIIIVDENDNEIGVKERDGQGDYVIFRVTALWLTNSDGDILLAQRSLNKVNSPGKWGPAVAGTVEEGETYESNIVKETEEEIGLSNIEFAKGPKIFNQTGPLKTYWCQYFMAVIDKKAEDFIIDKVEVEQVKWFKKEYLKKDFGEHPENYISSIKHFL